jgi:ABC-type nitrate/sulfonate/bicarbonate transport system substrate-binding protein
MVVGYAPMALLSAMDFAAQEGVTVSWDFSDGPLEAIDHVAANEAQVTFINSVFGYIKRAQGKPVKPFYGWVNGQNRSFAVPVDSPITSISELKGKVIGTDYSDLVNLAAPSIRSEGVAFEDVEFRSGFLPVPGMATAPESLEAIRNGEVDALWVLDLHYGVSEAEGIPLRRLPAPAVLDDLTPAACLYTNEEFAASSPEVLKAFSRAVARSTAFCLDHPEEAIRAVWEHFPNATPAPGTEDETLARDLASLSARRDNQVLRGDDAYWGKITVEEVDRWQDFLFTNGLVDSKVDSETYFAKDVVESLKGFDPRA